jgi:hypothetical protein
VTGWTPLSTVTTGSTSVTTVWKKVAGSGDSGGAITFTAPTGTTGLKAAVTVLAYRGTSTVDPVSAFAGVAETVSRTTHTTPTVTVPGNNSWVVSLWTDRMSTTTSMTPPATETQRSATCGTGGGHVCTLASDGNAPVAAGATAGGLTATADVANVANTMWTIVLAPDA